MNRKLLFLLLFILAFAGRLYSQNNLVKQWDKTLGGTYHEDNLFTTQQTNDGGYILGGWSDSPISGDKTQNSWAGSPDYWIVKIDSVGNKQWDKVFGGTNYEVFTCLHQTKDLGFIIGGHSFSNISGDKTQNTWGMQDYWIVKVDSVGNKEWDKDFGGIASDLLTCIQQTQDDGYILAGISGSGISGDKTQNNWGDWDYWIVKIDSSGIKQWDKSFGGTGADYLYSLQQTADGGYILGGYSNSPISGDKTQNTWGGTDYWIIKIDSAGNQQWDKDIGGTGDDALFSLDITTEGYIMGGYSDSQTGGDKSQNSWSGSPDYWIVKTDTLGNKLWDKDFGGSGIEEFSKIVPLLDGGYLVSGDSYSNISGDKSEMNLGVEQTWILKIDFFGNKLWDKTIFTTGHDERGRAIQSQDTCFIITNISQAGIGGYKSQSNWDTTFNSHDYWISKFCYSTTTSIISASANQNEQFSIYPNPANTTLNLNPKENATIVIRNIVGEIVLNKFGKGSVELDISSLSPGIYFIQAGSEVRKFVKE